MMTRYEQGFMSKCAEYGIDGRMLLEKRAKDEGRNYAGPVGLIGGTVGGLLGTIPAIEEFNPSSIEGAAEHAAALKHLSPESLKTWKGWGTAKLSPSEARNVLTSKGMLLSDPAWIKQTRKLIRGENIGQILGAGGKIAGGAALAGIPLYALTKIIQNLASKKDKR